MIEYLVTYVRFNRVDEYLVNLAPILIILLNIVYHMHVMNQDWLNEIVVMCNITIFNSITLILIDWLGS